VIYFLNIKIIGNGLRKLYTYLQIEIEYCKLNFILELAIIQIVPPPQFIFYRD